MTIFRKGVVLVAVPLVAQGVFVALLSWYQERYAEAQFWSLHTKRVLDLGRRVEGQVVEAQAEARGYVLTGNPVFRGDPDRLVPEVGRDADALVDLVADNPTQEDRARRIARGAREATAFQVDLIRMSDGGGRAAATEQIRSGHGKELVDGVRADLDQFLAEEGRLDADREADLEQARRTVTAVLVGGAAASFLGTVGLAFLFSRGIGRRLEVLAENTRRLAAGLELAVPVGGSDEIAQVDTAFRHMAADLDRLAADRQAAAAALAELNRNLERRVAARTAELTEANRDLAQKNQENEMFVYSVSHDLRSPLVNLQGFSKELAKAGDGLRTLLAGEQTPADVREPAVVLLDGKMGRALGFIHAAVGRLGGIIDALLRLSRAGRVEYRWERVDMNRVLRQVMDALQGTVAEKRASICVRELLPAWGDATALGQVFANLVGNALTYLDPGRPGVIEISGTADPDGSVVYAVRDNGLGIPAAHYQKVFQLFQRVHPGVGAGDGLGLAIVARVVERHRGRVWVESTEGEGSTFFVRLARSRE